MGALARVLERLGRRVRARRLLEAALAIDEKHHGPAHPQVRRCV